jgi:hypothetical protein
MNTSQQLKSEIEAAASALGIAPSTVGERCGQGGRFYARLCDGRRVWPETADGVRAKIQQLLNAPSVASNADSA